MLSISKSKAQRYYGITQQENVIPKFTQDLPEEYDILKKTYVGHIFLY